MDSLKTVLECVSVCKYQQFIHLNPLSECQEKLDSAHSHAAPYEDALERLFPWIPDTLARLEGLGACPTEPEAVEQRKNKIEVYVYLLVHVVVLKAGPIRKFGKGNVAVY